MLEILVNQTWGRLKNAWKVATFPQVTPLWYDLRLWRSCARLALRGLLHRDAYALQPLVNERFRVEQLPARAAERPVSKWRTCSNPHCGWMGTYVPATGGCPRCGAQLEGMS